ncbi:MAG: polyprenyl synthetase family protein [Thermoplasmata archaeon]|nr:polyprenyl synthetase family protein [Thermoplasmata archaeon]
MDEIVEAVNKAIDNYLYEKEPYELYQAVRHLPEAGGKRLRPVIACLSCEASGGELEDAIPFGVALELVHTFTLVHDDIMDKDEMRRGMPSVHKKFGENEAILAGDTLFAKAFEVISLMKDAEIVKRLTRNVSIMAKEICEGQHMDMSFENVEYVDEKIWLEMIEKKTAKMFEHAAMGGAIIARADENKIEAMKNYGRNLGMAFQIWDDCLDVIGKDIGKPVGSDIREGKKTLMYLYAYVNSDRKWLSKYGKEEYVEEIIDIFRETGAIDYAKNKAKEFSEYAKKELEIFEDSEAKRKLIELADFAVEREK